jgi:hypothetical protein
MNIGIEGSPAFAGEPFCFGGSEAPPGVFSKDLILERLVRVGKGVRYDTADSKWVSSGGGADCSKAAMNRRTPK